MAEFMEQLAAATAAARAERNAYILELEAEIARLRALVGADVDDYTPLNPAETIEAIEAKGAEVGTITGPPIAGTTDSVNAGPARGARGEIVEPPAVIPPPTPWRPAGELGVIVDGVDVIEEPTNGAQPIVKQVGPGS